MNIGISQAVVKSCSDLGLTFNQRLQIYEALTKELRGQGDHPSPYHHPKDPAWAMATVRNPREDGEEDADQGVCRAYAFRLLLEEGHPCALEYEAGYTSISKEDRRFNAYERLCFVLEGVEREGSVGRLLEIARVLKAFLDADGALEEFQLRLDVVGLSVEWLLEQEAKGELYPLASF